MRQPLAVRGLLVGFIGLTALLTGSGCDVPEPPPPEPDAGEEIPLEGCPLDGQCPDDFIFACPKGQFTCKDPKTGAQGPCSDHKSDIRNCGKCGNVCSKTEKCVNGACTGPNTCPPGQFICTDPKGSKGPCSDHKSDPVNCGKCGNVCSKTEKCVNGACTGPNTCPPGQFICTDPKGSKGPCSDRKSDPVNCGKCGNVCSKTEKCVNGACTGPNTCPPGQFICTDPKGSKGPCSDHKNDPANCGTCGNVCPKTLICKEGQCGDGACPPGQFVCMDPKGGKGPCMNHDSDPTNCGACGNVCSKTQKCVKGDCVTHNPCPPGQFICTDLKGAAGPCSDHKSDPINCGTCGNVCSKTQKCTNGACVTPNPCPPGQFICTDLKGAAGPCSDHKSDPINCGTCGNVCSKTQKCIDGACVSPNACPPGQFTCTNNDGSKGPCSDHKSDPIHCGNCGIACAKTQTCTNGVCTNPACPPGQWQCLQPGGLSPCSDHKSDSVHCGFCGNTCIKPTSCKNGVCQ